MCNSIDFHQFFVRLLKTAEKVGVKLGILRVKRTELA